MLHRGECDGQILDGEAGGVEQGDVVGVLAARGVAGEHRSQLCHVPARDQASVNRGSGIAAVARLLPIVHEQPHARC